MKISLKRLKITAQLVKDNPLDPDDDPVLIGNIIYEGTAKGVYYDNGQLAFDEGKVTFFINIDELLINGYIEPKDPANYTSKAFGNDGLIVLNGKIHDHYFVAQLISNNSEINGIGGIGFSTLYSHFQNGEQNMIGHCNGDYTAAFIADSQGLDPQ